MCISSSVKARMITEAKLHPALDLLKSGYPVAVCTDDPLIFRTNHTQENKLVQELLGFSDSEMREVHNKSMGYAFN